MTQKNQLHLPDIYPTWSVSVVALVKHCCHSLGKL